MKKMTFEYVIRKMFGKIKPIGNSFIDSYRLENLKDMCEAVGSLMQKIKEVSDENKDRHEHSMKTIGIYANDFLESMKELIN